MFILEPVEKLEPTHIPYRFVSTMRWLSWLHSCVRENRVEERRHEQQANPTRQLKVYFIDRNHFCTKSLGVSGSRGFRISAFWLPDSFQKTVQDIPLWSSGLVCPSSWVLTYTKSTLSLKPYPKSSRVFSVNVNMPLNVFVPVLWAPS